MTHMLADGPPRKMSEGDAAGRPGALERACARSRNAIR